MDKFSKVAFAVTGACGAIFAISNWDALTMKAQTVLQGTSNEAEANYVAGSIWSYSQSVDEMTDRTHSKASANFAWAGGNMAVDIECIAPEKLSYTFLAFDAEGEGVPFRYELGENALGEARQFTTVKVRIDERTAVSFTVPFKNYTNEIYLAGNTEKWMKELSAIYGHRSSVDVNDMASARLLRIAIQANDREGVLRIEQDDPIVRRVFAACSAGRSNQIIDGNRSNPETLGKRYPSADPNPEGSLTKNRAETPPLENAYSFADFPIVASIFTVVEPQLDGAQKEFRSFRTRIKAAVTEGPVFAGRVAIAQFGCGTSCKSGLAIDLSTGNIVSLPLGGEEHPDSEWEFQKNSRLMKVAWVDAWAEPKCHGQGYFEWNGSDFKQLAITDYPSGCTGKN
ncbi:hypothetical protein [Sphingobium sp. B11D3A]|uniref:hypothetical protein n=1 Tax=Sphingobium sp. B11D3A TaxID=2940574 RepID=UPI00222534DF|nr:hypothetical protein [Sphingobium sp. B11D3A]MCW2392263.1 hypothetical protein [Sphingobium sp. B11D3A]